MEQKSIRHDVIIAGVGGRGALIIGQLLAQAAKSSYEHILWCPNMTTARRGAPVDCTVILSSEEITSPLVLRAKALIIVDSSQLKPFEHRVQPRGLIIVDTSGLRDKVARGDVSVLEIPSMEMAAKLGDTRVGNFILLGAYVGTTKVVSPESIGKELERRFSNDKKMLSFNAKAFQEGLRLANYNR